MGNPELRDIQLIELDILCEFDRICRKYNIKYFLDSGTAIGAIRHKGFIPWDDDIDVGMLRNDYEHFLKVAQKELRDEYFLESYKTEKECPYLFTKIRKNNTVYMEWCHRNLNTHHGIYIDIFTFDYVPENIKERNRYIRNGFFLKTIFTLRTTRDRTIPPQNSIRWVIMSIMRRLLHYMTCLLVPREPLIKLIDSYYQKYKNIPQNNAICFAYNQKIIFPVDYLLPTKMVTFEEKEFPVPLNYKEYLNLQFGDFTILPPKEERVGHTPYKVYYVKEDLV